MGKELRTNQDHLSHNNQESLILYGAAASPCVRRVVITLLEKKLAFDWVEVDLANMEQRSPAYLTLNPNGFVPTLCHGNRVIYESGVINEYLDEQFPEKPLLPSEPYERAQARMWLAAELAMAKTFRPIMYQRLLAPIQHVSRSLEEAEAIAMRFTRDATDIEWERKIWHMEVLTPTEEAQKEQELFSWLDIVEKGLQGQHYLVGNRFSQADISLFPRISMYCYLDKDLDQNRYPNVLDWLKRLEQHTSFQDSQPEAAKKLEKLASTPILPKLRKILAKRPKQRSLIDKSFVWGIGKLLRKIQNINTLLAPSNAPRELPLPKSNTAPPAKKYIDTGSDYSGEFELFYDEASPDCVRIELLLKVIGVDFVKTPIDIQKEEHKAPSFLHLNPLASVPVLRHGDRILYDANTIAEYLIAEQAANSQWQLTHSDSRAEQRLWLALEAGTHKEFSPLWDRYVAKVDKPRAFITDEKNTLTRIENKIQRLENQLKKTNFLTGEVPRYADIAWYTQLLCLHQVPTFDLQTFPAIAHWLSEMKMVLDSLGASMDCTNQSPSQLDKSYDLVSN
jgi:glutathione S-transferase